MIETIVLKAEKRQATGTRSARKVRAAGMIPMVIYGHKQEALAVQTSYHDLALELQHRHRLLTVELDGEQEQLLVKDVQYDHLYEKIMHVDLTHVNLDERVEMTVMVELRGTPAGAAEGGVLDQALAEVTLECPVTDIPERVRASVLHLQVGDSLVAGDLELPEGSKLVTDAAAVVAAVRVLAEEPEEEVVEDEAATSEPEVIGEKQEEEGETEES